MNRSIFIAAITAGLIGFVIWLGERLSQLMEGHGYRLGQYQGNDGWFVPLPATFVVGPRDLVIARQVGLDFRKRMEIDQILAALQSTRR